MGIQKNEQGEQNYKRRSAEKNEKTEKSPKHNQHWKEKNYQIMSWRVSEEKTHFLDGKQLKNVVQLLLPTFFEKTTHEEEDSSALD